MKDLAVLVADKNMDFAMRGILGRPKSIGIRVVSYGITPHGGRAEGVRTSGPETLARLRKEFSHGIMMLDWEGSGSKAESAVALEQELDSRLSPVWGNEAKAIVIEPELDVWIWGSDNALVRILHWQDSQSIRAWLAERGHEFDGRQKPVRPKEALEDLMVQLDEPRSSNLYQRITKSISLPGCVDPAFNRLTSKLRSWFPP